MEHYFQSIKKVSLVYFSPTGNTKKTVKAIVEGLLGMEGESAEAELEVEVIDLTLPGARDKSYSFGPEELVIFGAPVYAGRIPGMEERQGGIFRGISGDQTPAVLAVTYGNREYEDALLELKNICEEKGFVPTAGGAFIGEHSYSEKIATGRPNEEDLEQMRIFGRAVREKLEGDNPLTEPQIPGNEPYRDGMGPLPIVPEADGQCIKCGLCALKCPMGAISKEDLKHSDVEKCIRCYACIRLCARKIRSIKAAPFLEKVAALEAMCADRHKEPETFL